MQKLFPNQTVLDLCTGCHGYDHGEDCLLRYFGTIGQIDILVNNAGLALGLTPYQDYEELDMLTMLDTNVKGLMAVTRCFLPAMVKVNQGHIINMGSTAGIYA